MKGIVAVTGHRPNKFGGYSYAAYKRLETVAYDWLSGHRPEELITGMALGWDQACAIAAIKLDIKVHAAIPFIGQQYRWNSEDKQQYQYILEHCVKRTIVSEGGYTAFKMQLRNKWMVDHCDLLLECFDGSRGGTYNTDEYARKQNKKIINLYERWKYKIYT